MSNYVCLEKKWKDAILTMDSVSSNERRKGDHLDIRIVGPDCSIFLMELEEFRQLVKATNK